MRAAVLLCLTRSRFARPFSRTPSLRALYRCARNSISSLPLLPICWDPSSPQLVRSFLEAGVEARGACRTKATHPNTRGTLRVRYYLLSELIQWVSM